MAVLGFLLLVEAESFVAREQPKSHFDMLGKQRKSHVYMFTSTYIHTFLTYLHTYSNTNVYGIYTSIQQYVHICAYIHECAQTHAQSV